MPTTATSHYLLHEGGNLAKPPVVLIHGAGGDHLSWPLDLRRLPDCRVFTPDLPGHGRSEGPGRQSAEEYARGIVDFLDAAGLSKAVFVGYSLGGAIALTLALDYPDRVAGIVLIATGPRLPIPSTILENVTAPSTLPLAVRTLQEMSLSPQTPDSMKKALLERLTAVRRTLLLSDLLACDRFNVSNRLDEIRTPTLVICGEEDRLTPLRFSKTLATHINGAALQVVDGAGHMLILEQPRRLAKLIGVFLMTVPYTPGM